MFSFPMALSQNKSASMKNGTFGIIYYTFQDEWDWEKNIEKVLPCKKEMNTKL